MKRLLLLEYVTRTGYPEEMLDLDLDLEAELGIDTVKQVAALAAVRERLGLAPDPGFKLREASTLAKAIEVLARRVAGAPRDPPPGPPGGAPRPSAVVPTSSTVGSAAPVAVTRAAPHGPATAARLLEAMLSAAGARAPAELVAVALAGAAGPGAREPLVEVSPPAEPGSAVLVRARLGDASAEGSVASLAAGAVAPAAPDVLAAVDAARRAPVASGEELRRALAPLLGDAEGVLAWARSEGFMVATGGASVPAGIAPRRAAAMLAAAAELAAFAWVGLTGAPHAPCAIARAVIHAVPEPGAELGLRARMVPPEQGNWRADVDVVAGGALVAELRGLEGVPTASRAAAGPAADAADRAWRRFSRRMRGEQGGGVDEGVA